MYAGTALRIAASPSASSIETLLVALDVQDGGLIHRDAGFAESLGRRCLAQLPCLPNLAETLPEHFARLHERVPGDSTDYRVAAQ